MKSCAWLRKPPCVNAAQAAHQSRVQINWLTTKKYEKLHFFNSFSFQSNNNYFNGRYGQPLRVINSITRFGIDSTSFLQFCEISLSRYHTSFIASISFVSVVQSLFKSRVYAMLHTFSIGFRENEFPGQSRTLMWFFFKNFFTFFAVWQEAKSCRKIPPPFGNTKSAVP